MTAAIATPRGRHAENPSTRVLSSSNLLVGYLLLLLLLPARLVLPGMGAAGRPAVVAGLAFLVWWLITHLHPELTPRGRQPVRWLCLILTIGVLASYSAAFDRGLLPLEARSAARFLLTLGSWLGVALIAADGLKGRRDISKMITAIIACSCVSAAIGVLQFFNVDLAPYVKVPGLVYNEELVGIRTRGGPQFNRVYGTQQHYIEFGVVLAMAMPLAIHAALKSPKSRASWARWSAVALIGAAIPLSISRAGFLGLVVGFVVLSLVWAMRLRLRAYLIALLALVAFRVVMPGVLGTIRSAFLNFGNDPSIINRRVDYAATRSYLQDRPWFGRGPGTFVPEIYRVLDNQILGSLLELGLVGTTTVVAIFVGTYSLGRHVRRRADSEADAHLGQALAATATVAFVASLTFDSLSFPTFAALLFILLGLSGALWRIYRSSEDIAGVPLLCNAR